MKTWLKEPLLHFLLIGTFVFILFPVSNEEKQPVTGNKIIVTAADVGRLAQTWSKKWNRYPTRSELQGLIESFIKEEVYYREALSLGLDQNDTVIRRRLMQKMEFLSNDLAELNKPDEKILNAYFLKHQDKYELPAQISFTHIYFSPDKHGRSIIQVSGNLLDELRNASPRVLSAPDRGDSIMLPSNFSLETPFEIARLFGQEFTEKLLKAEINTWLGPIKSGYGIHLVRISEKVDARTPELSSVIDQVRADWMFEQQKKINKTIYERFKDRYVIEIEEMSMQSSITMTAVSSGGTT